MQQNNKGRLEKITIKLDIAKTYDRMEWNYLKAAMKAFVLMNNG